MLFFLLLIFVIINNSLIYPSIIESTDFFLQRVLPSLFIILFIVDLLINYNSVIRIGKLIHPLFKFIFHSPNEIISGIILLAPFLGTPGNIKLIYDLYKKNIISKRNSTITFMFSNYVSLPFILIMAEGFPYKPFFIIIPILSNIILGIALGIKYENDDLKLINNKITFIESIKKNTITLMMIFSIIVFTNAFIKIITHYLAIDTKYLGLIELTLGLSMLNNNDNYLFILLSSFAGLSIHFQVYSIIKKDLSYFLFFIGRIISTAIALGLFFLVMQFY